MAVVAVGEPAVYLGWSLVTSFCRRLRCCYRRNDGGYVGCPRAIPIVDGVWAVVSSGWYCACVDLSVGSLMLSWCRGW